MKIISRAELMEMPSGTLYCRYTPDTAFGLYQKGETLRRDDDSSVDWYYSSLLPEFDLHRHRMVFDASECRDGFFDHDARYVVYEPEDVAQLLGAITSCIPK